MLLIFILTLWAYPLNQVMQLYTPSVMEITIANARMHANDTVIHPACQRIKPEGDTENLQSASKSVEDVYWNTSSIAVVSRSQDSATIPVHHKSIVQTPQPTSLMLIGLCLALIFDDLWMMVIGFINNLHTKNFDARLNKVVKTGCIYNPCMRLLLRIFLVGICIYIAHHRSSQYWNLTDLPHKPKAFWKKKKKCQEPPQISGATFVKSTTSVQNLKTHATVGDGNCFWRARAHRLPFKWYSLKARILIFALRSYECSEHERKDIRNLMKRNAWANSTAIKYAARYLQCNIAVWHKGGFGIFPSGLQSAPTIFLTLCNQHFEALPTKTGLELLATCDPLCPIPIEALAYCNGSDYEEGTTNPQRTIKHRRPKFYEGLAECIKFPNRILDPGEIAFGIREACLDCLPQPMPQCNSHPKQLRNRGTSSKNGMPTRTCWPIWYLLVIFGLRCLGLEPPRISSPNHSFPGSCNHSGYTFSEEFNDWESFQKSIPSSPKPLKVTQDDNIVRVTACYNTCVGAVAENYSQNSSAEFSSQDCRAISLRHGLDATRSSTPDVFRDPFIRLGFDPNSSFWGGFCCQARNCEPAMVVSRAEVELERRFRSLRSELDTDDSTTTTQERQQLNNRYQVVMRALMTKRIGRSKSRSPIRRRTRRELNRLMRGSESGLRGERVDAALEQQQTQMNEASTGSSGSRPLRPTEPDTPPPWCRQFYIETWGTSPQRPMAPSAFENKAQAQINIRLHNHDDPGRDPHLHKHAGLHSTTLLRHARHPEIQKALACVLRMANQAQSVHVNISCLQGRHRSVAFSQCLKTLVEMQNHRCTVRMHHRGSLYNWWRLCRTDTCEECNLYCSSTPDGRAYKDELQRTLNACFTLDVMEHPYVCAQSAPAYTECVDASGCVDACNAHVDVAYIGCHQDDSITNNWDALEHPACNTTDATKMQSRKTLSPSLLFPNKVFHSCSPSRPGKEAKTSTEAPCHQYCNVSFVNLIGHLYQTFLLWIFIGGFLHQLNPLIIGNEHNHLCKDLTFSSTQFWQGCKKGCCDSSSACHIKQSSVIAKDCNTQTPFTFPGASLCHNSGRREDSDSDGCNSILGNYEGISLIKIQGLPKHPYGADLTGGCVGAAHLPEGEHCKFPRSGLPKPPFGLTRSLVSRLLLIGEPFCNPGYFGMHCHEWVWRSPCASMSADCRPEEALNMMYAHTGAFPCPYQHAITNVDVGCCLEAPSTCNFHLDALQTLKPPVQGSSKFICGPHLFIGGSCLQSRNHSKSAYHLIHLAMDLSPQELQLERDLRRMRNEMDSGEVRTDSGRWNYLLAQMRLSNGERLAHRAERQQDVPARDRSRSPILRRTHRQLNRLMRGAEAEEEPLPGPGSATPKTPPKAPPASGPVLPKTPPKKPSAPTPATGSAPVRPRLPFSLDPSLLGTMVPKTPPKRASDLGMPAPVTPPSLSLELGRPKRRSRHQLRLEEKLRRHRLHRLLRLQNRYMIQKHLASRSKSEGSSCWKCSGLPVLEGFSSFVDEDHYNHRHRQLQV